jgi:hypothetical protein
VFAYLIKCLADTIACHTRASGYPAENARANRPRNRPLSIKVSAQPPCTVPARVQQLLTCFALKRGEAVANLRKPER